jgi:short subunit fatty acids transporter
MSVVEVEAPVAGSATAGLPVLAAAVVHVAVPVAATVASSATALVLVLVLVLAAAEFHVAEPAAPAAANVTDSCDPVGKHYSIRDHHCRHVYIHCFSSPLLKLHMHRSGHLFTVHAYAQNCFQSIGYYEVAALILGGPFVNTNHFNYGSA